MESTFLLACTPQEGCCGPHFKRKDGIQVAGMLSKISLSVLCLLWDLLSLIFKNLSLPLSFSCSRKPLESFAALDTKCSRSAHILEASVTEGILRAVSQAGKFGEQPAP